MSQEELVSAYIDGRISRRTLIRRLVGTGVSIGAAVAYAHVLKPERAFARADQDHYPDMSVRIVEEDLDKVVNRKRLVTRVRADEDAELRPLHMRAFLVQHGTETALLGERFLDFDGPDRRRVKIRLTPAGVAVLEGRNRARVRVYWLGADRQGKLPNGRANALLHS